VNAQVELRHLHLVLRPLVVAPALFVLRRAHRELAGGDAHQPDADGVGELLPRLLGPWRWGQQRGQQEDCEEGGRAVRDGGPCEAPGGTARPRRGGGAAVSRANGTCRGAAVPARQTALDWLRQVTENRRSRGGLDRATTRSAALRRPARPWRSRRPAGALAAA